MIGIELDRDCSQLRDTARAAGLIINVACGNVIRLVPQFILSSIEGDLINVVLNKLVMEF